jgi:LacI family transcriptional regulator
VDSSFAARGLGNLPYFPTRLGGRNRDRIVGSDVWGTSYLSRIESGDVKSRGSTSPTVHDVARLSGVSAATVSRFLNNHRIRPDLEARVRAAVDQLDYRPNTAARFMKGSKTGTIGLIVPEIDHPYFAAILEGASQEARDNDQLILAASSHGKRANETLVVDQFSRSIIDGLIYAPVATGELFPRRDVFRNLPVVITARRGIYPDLVHVYSDTRRGGYLSTKYLLSLERRQVSFIASFWEPICDSQSIMDMLSTPNSGAHASLERFRGYLDALEEMNVTYDPSLVIVCGYTYESGFEAGTQLLTRLAPFDAIVTASDLVAAGAIGAFEAQGLDVPRDVSVVGYGDQDVGRVLRPSLTSIRQNVYELGVKSVKTMNALLHGERPDDWVEDVELIVRESTVKSQTNST